MATGASGSIYLASTEETATRVGVAVHLDVEKDDPEGLVPSPSQTMGPPMSG